MTTVDLTAGLRQYGIEAEPCVVRLNETEITRVIAEAAAEEMRQNIQAGLAPDGRAARSLKRETSARKGHNRRGVDTGSFVNSIRARAEGQHYVVVAGVNTGQHLAALGRRGFNVNMQSHRMRDALDNVARMITGDGYQMHGPAVLTGAAAVTARKERASARRRAAAQARAERRRAAKAAGG